jgi:diguanylate cyclase (GGDEF)-like protein
MGIFRDISDRKIMEERLRSTSITDMLTGVLNRRGFFTLAHKQWKLADRSRKAMALLFIDLDGLKQINDDWGHRAGDLALIDTARILKESFRESDIIARIGGDEFSVLITELAETDMMDVITRHVYENVEKHNKEGRRSYHLSISMGVVNYDPDHPRSVDELMTEADALMYENKKRKFNRKIRETS